MPQHLLLKKGDRLLVNIRFLDHPIDCKARVIRFLSPSQKPLAHLAVSFEGLSGEDKKFIEEISAQFKERRKG